MTTVSYARNVVDARQARVAQWFYRAALVLAILPSIFGVGCLIGYWTTYEGNFMLAGMFMLPIGLGMITLGLAFLGVWGIMDFKIARPLNRRFNHKKFWLTMILLLSNFGVALGCMAGGIYLWDRAWIEVRNETGATIDACTIVLVPASKIHLGVIPPSERVRHPIKGEISGLELRQGANHAKVPVAGTGSGSPNHNRVHIQPGLTVDVETLD